MNINKKCSQAHGIIKCNHEGNLHGILEYILELQKDWKFGRFDGEVRDVEMVLLREPYNFHSTGEGSLYNSLENFFENIFKTFMSIEESEYLKDEFLINLDTTNITLSFNDHEETAKLLYSCDVKLWCDVEEYIDGTFEVKTLIDDLEIKHYEYNEDNLKKLGY